MSGEASLAYWTVAPAVLVPAPARLAAIGAATVFGTTVGLLRVGFGRHFVSDVILAGVLTVLIVVLLYRLLLAHKAQRRRAMHAGTGAALAGAGARAGVALREAGLYLHKNAVAPLARGINS